MKKVKGKVKQPETLVEWCEDFSRKAAIDVYTMFEEERDKVGAENHRHLTVTFLAGFVSALVYRSLANIPDSIKSDEERCQYANDSFSDLKMRIQEAVASGFSGGMRTWSGRTVDYYCQVKVVPEPKNKDFC